MRRSLKDLPGACTSTRNGHRVYHVPDCLWRDPTLVISGVATAHAREGEVEFVGSEADIRMTADCPCCYVPRDRQSLQTVDGVRRIVTARRMVESEKAKAASSANEGGSDGHVASVRPGNDDVTAKAAELALARFEHPVSGLSPAAQRVLNGAMHVVVTKGFGKLTLANISAASGENVAAVKYYFGNKAGLVDVILQTVAYSELRLLTRQRRTGSTELNRLAKDILVLSTPDRYDKILIELLPHAMRDKKLRQHLRNYYETFYETFFELLLEQRAAGATVDSATRARMSGFATLFTAVADGLTIQALVTPQNFDSALALSALDELIEHGLPNFVDPECG